MMIEAGSFLARALAGAMLRSALLLVVLQGALTPARIASGPLPEQPPLAADGGLVLLEAEVTVSGQVGDVASIQGAPPFGSVLERAVHLWRFRPAQRDGEAVASRVLVMGIFRPPVLMGGDVVTTTPSGSFSGGVPHPTSVVTPSFPPQALEDGLLLVEIAIDVNGTVTGTRLVHSSPAFDEPALEAAAEFRFRPARIDGEPVPSFALAVFGFRQPITSRRPPG